MKSLIHSVYLLLTLIGFQLFADIEKRPNSLPSVFWGTIVLNNDQTIPLFLKSLENIQYEKKQIILQMNLFNDSEATKKQIEEWIGSNEKNYRQIILVDNSALKNKRFNEKDFNHVIAGIKDEYLVKTKMLGCDYGMITASDVFLEPKTVSTLIQKKKPIIAPLLRPLPEPADPFRNFFADVTDAGYYKDHKDYYPIANREKLGTFKVPCVHMAYLINAEYIDKLSFSDQFIHWELISFSNNARRNNVSQYICNENEFGFFLHFNKGQTPEEEKSFALLKSDLTLTPELIQEVLRPYEEDLRDADPLNVIDPKAYTLFRIQNRDLYFLDDNRDYIKNYLLKKGITWKEHLHERFKTYVKPGTIALDIGGYIGIHTLSLSRLVGEEGKVHVFEPQSKVFCELAVNMYINDCRNVVLHKVALGNQEKWIDVHLPKEEWTKNFGPDVINEGHGTVRELSSHPNDKTKMIRLDSLHLDPISFVKLDVEGDEMEVIEGGKETLLRDRPVMMIKLFDTSDKDRKIKQIESLGYYGVWIENEDYLFLPFHLIEEQMVGEGSKLKRSSSESKNSLRENLTEVSGPTATEKPISVVWEGTFVDLGSLSNVNRCITDPLSKFPAIHLTRVGPNTLTPKLSGIPELLETAKVVQTVSPEGTQITVRHAWPPNWNAPAKGKWVIIQPWEFGALPEEWVSAIKNVDEVWAPSHYVKREYIESGVSAEKVFVVPNGIDPTKFSPEGKSYPLKTNKKFKFLFLGGTIWRKGGDLLVKTYLRTFKSDDDVALVIKDFGSKGCYAGQTHENQIKAAQNVPGNPEIIYLDHDMSAEEIGSLYRACDCLVYPYRGEGFALPVLEAMASGLPVIVTAGGPTDDFVIDASGWFIPSKEKTYGPTVGDMKLVGESWLLEPDTEMLSAQMRWLASHPLEVKIKGEAASQHARKNWTWQQAASIAAERIKALTQGDLR